WRSYSLCLRTTSASSDHLKEVAVWVSEVYSSVASEGISGLPISRCFRIIPEGYPSGAQSIHDTGKSLLIDAKGDMLTADCVGRREEKCPGLADGEAVHLAFMPIRRSRR